MSVFNKKVVISSLCIFSISVMVVATAAITEKISQTMSSEKIELTKHYDNTDSKYAINYPANWIIDDTETGAVVFSGKEGTPAYYSTVNIQAILSKKMGGQYASVSEVVSDIKKQVLKESPKTTFLTDGPYEMLLESGVKLSGHVLIFIYSYQGHIVEQWQIVVPRKGEFVFYTWAYTAPLEQYKNDLPIAKAMLATWVIR